MRSHCFLTLSPDHEPLWGRLHLHQIGDEWAAMTVAAGVEPPRQGEVKGMGCFGGTPAKAKEVALR